MPVIYRNANLHDLHEENFISYHIARKVGITLIWHFGRLNLSPPSKNLPMDHNAPPLLLQVFSYCQLGMPSTLVTSHRPN